jgi:hypothetical protein
VVASETTVEPMDRSEAIKRLLILRSDKGYPRDPRALLDLAALPTLVLRHPRSMSGLDASVELMQLLLSAGYPLRYPERVPFGAADERLA